MATKVKRNGDKKGKETSLENRTSYRVHIVRLSTETGVDTMLGQTLLISGHDVRQTQRQCPFRKLSRMDLRSVEANSAEYGVLWNRVARELY